MSWFVLATDALLFLVIIVLGALVCLQLKNKDSRLCWQQVGNSVLAMVAATVFLSYLCIAVLDSIHYRVDNTTNESSNESSNVARPVQSLLDIWAPQLWEKNETSYSAPFATHSLQRVHRIDEHGKEKWHYPRLIHGGKHLGTQYQPSDKKWDILQKIITAVSYGILCAILIGLIILALAWSILRRYQSIAFLQLLKQKGVITVFLTSICIIALATTAYYLSYFYHIFGTDKVGQDVFFQAVKSIRTGIIIGTLTTVIMLPLAIALGICAGYFRGWIDDLIQYIYTTLNSIPGVLLISASILVLDVYIETSSANFPSLIERADLKLLMLCVILGITSWTGLCRLIRAETMKLKELNYIKAAKALGIYTPSIMLRHLLPNLMHLILIVVVLDFSYLVLAEMVLAYMDIGVDPSTPSWGNMINSARLELGRDPIVWWSLTASFFFMLGLVLSVNILSNKIQQAFEPQQKGNN